MEWNSYQVGLAVGDTETMKKFATIKRLALQIRYHIKVEDAYPTFITRAVYQVVYVEKPNKLSRHHRYVLSMTTCSSGVGFVSDAAVVLSFN